MANENEEIIKLFKQKYNLTEEQIDEIISKHYGFSEEELDYIINYDIKYRMGMN